MAHDGDKEGGINSREQLGSTKLCDKVEDKVFGKGRGLPGFPAERVKNGPKCNISVKGWVLCIFPLFPSATMLHLGIG